MSEGHFLRVVKSELCPGEYVDQNVSELMFLGASLFLMENMAAIQLSRTDRVRQTSANNFFLFILLASGVLASFLSSAPAYADARADAAVSARRTWKTVAKLSLEERANIDLSPELRARVQA